MDRAGQALGEWLGGMFDWSKQDREIAAFSLTLILSSTFFLVLLFALSLAFGVLVEAFAMAFSAGVLRTFAGGAHLSTGWRCGIVSAGAATLVAVLAHSFGPMIGDAIGGSLAILSVAIALFITWIMAKTAPVDVPEKPITSDRQRQRLRTMSILIPLAWGLGAAIALFFGFSGNTTPLGSDLHTIWLASAAGLLWETFSVVPPGMRFVRWLDERIEGYTQHK